MFLHFLIFGVFSFLSLNGGFIAPDDQIIENALLPEYHPLQNALKNLFHHSSMFDSPAALEQAGFVMKWNRFNVRPGTILVASHPSLKGYLIKKHRNSPHQFSYLERYLARIKASQAIDTYIKNHAFEYLIVPQKWLYRLPQAFNDPKTGMPDYLLVVEEIDICEGGCWGGETLERYRTINKKALKQLCFLLYDLQGCDAWPQNQPFTHSGKIAFIDTEHLGMGRGDFLERTIKFIDPNLVDWALQLWNRRKENTATSQTE